jgi:hypothetical protein
MFVSCGMTLGGFMAGTGFDVDFFWPLHSAGRADCIEQKEGVFCLV